MFKLPDLHFIHQSTQAVLRLKERKDSEQKEKTKNSRRVNTCKWNIQLPFMFGATACNLTMAVTLFLFCSLDYDERDKSP